LKLINYYQVLQVQEGSNREEIKNSFRRLVKKYHPDKNKKNGDFSEEKIKVLIKAYKTLTDSQERLYYDKLLQNRNVERYYYTKENKDDELGLVVQAKGILNDLLNKNGYRAIRNYELLKKENEEFNLFAFLGLKDYLDCKFLLAEEYEKQGNYKLAFKLYEDVYQKEDGNPARRYLQEEIKERILRLSCKKLVKLVQGKPAIAYLNRVLNINLNKIERAFVYKKIADCYLSLGEWDSSMINFKMAISLHPKLKGTQTLRNKLHEYFLQKNSPV
jgi:curved DNA-binding protein CbpA